MKTKKIEKTKKVSKKEEGFTRIAAFADAIRSKPEGKIAALVVAANKRYVAQGKADNLKEAKTVTEWSLKVLVAMKLATIEGDSYKLN